MAWKPNAFFWPPFFPSAVGTKYHRVRVVWGSIAHSKRLFQHVFAKGGTDVRGCGPAAGAGATPPAGLRATCAARCSRHPFRAQNFVSRREQSPRMRMVAVRRSNSSSVPSPRRPPRRARNLCRMVVVVGPCSSSHKYLKSCPHRSHADVVFPKRLHKQNM